MLVHFATISACSTLVDLVIEREAWRWLAKIFASSFQAGNEGLRLKAQPSWCHSGCFRGRDRTGQRCGEWRLEQDLQGHAVAKRIGNSAVVAAI